MPFSHPSVVLYGMHPLADGGKADNPDNPDNPDKPSVSGFSNSDNPDNPDKPFVSGFSNPDNPDSPSLSGFRISRHSIPTIPTQAYKIQLV